MVFLPHFPLIIYFNGEAMLYYSHFLKEFIKSSIANDHFKLPSIDLIVCIFLAFIKMHLCDNIFIRYHSHLAKGKPTLSHEHSSQFYKNCLTLFFSFYQNNWLNFIFIRNPKSPINKKYQFSS
jgi:hypothetical protein